MMRGGLSGAAGETVAGGTWEGRLVSVGSERLSEDAAKGVIEPHALHLGMNTGEPGSVGSDQRGGLVVTG